LQSPALAAGQVGDRRPLPRRREAEPLQQLPGRDLCAADGRVAGHLLDRFEHPLLFGQLVDLLGQVRGAHRQTDRDPAALRCRLPDQQPQQSGLARPVHTYHGNPLPRPDPPRCVVQQDPGAGLGRHVLDVVDVLAEPGRCQRPQGHAVPRRRLVGDQRRRGVEPEARLGRAGRRATTQPGQLLAQQVGPPGLGRIGHPDPLGPGEYIGRVAPLVRMHLAAGHLPGRRTDRVEEPPVVGDHDQAAPPPGQVTGQPRHALDVEVVGRLVEHQQIGFGDQQRRQRHPAALATGEPLDRCVQAHLMQAEPVEHLAYPGVAGPLVHRVEGRPEDD